MLNEKILILLSTYNGEKFLKEQLDSLFSQTYKNFEVIVRDDGSKDDTKKILDLYNITLLEENNNLGPIGSFSFLLEYAIKKTTCKYFMFCDQDDVWYENKIKNTYEKMKEMEREKTNLPILIHTDLEVVDENLNTIDKSFKSYLNLTTKYNKLSYLLLQNNITGCTVMLNRQLGEISIPVSKDTIMHDWWIGLVATEFGKVGYLNKSTIAYRQHQSNKFGAKKYKAWAFLFATRKSLNIIYIQAQAQAFLDTYRSKMDIKTIKMLEVFLTIESKSFLEKRVILLRYKILKQNFVRNIVLFIQI